MLARAGFGSRRACEDLIRQGRVAVNGQVAEIGQSIDASQEVVHVDGVPVGLDRELTYLALHKPLDVITTAKDTHGRATVVELVPDEPRVFPIGRLDRDTSGLLLLTNDGDFANHVAHPRYEIPKTYVAEVRGRPRRAQLDRLRSGVELADGRAAARTLEVSARGPNRTLLELTVTEGRNRLVRRLVDAVELELLSLTRVAVGDVRLGRLGPGDWRHLRREEIQALRGTAGTVD